MTTKRNSNSQAYDFGPIQDFIDREGITVEAFAKRAGASPRTVARMKKGIPIDRDFAEAIAQAAGLELDDLSPPSFDPKIAAQAAEARRQLNCIAYMVARERRRVIDRPDLAKAGDDVQNIDKDTIGSYIDIHLAKFARKQLILACEHLDSPLHAGCYFWEEELPLERIAGDHDPRDFAAVFDTNDDSKMSDAGLGGQGVFSIHHRTYGLIVCVVVDYQRNRLYSATAFEPTLATELVDLSQPIDPRTYTSNPQGVSLPLTPSDQRHLSGAKINVFLGKSVRVKLAAQYLGTLLDEKIDVFPFGGARGPCLTADGTIDACVETYKGMRYLDAIPALLLVQQANGVCLDPETGNRLQLHNSRGLFAALDENDIESLAHLRRRFIAAGCQNLAKAILARIPDVSHVEHVGNRKRPKKHKETPCPVIGTS